MTSSDNCFEAKINKLYNNYDMFIKGFDSRFHISTIQRKSLVIHLVLET